MLTHGSLFAGIGGFDLGFERAGIRTIWQVEIDAYCRRLLAKNFPLAVRFDDIRTVCGIQHAHPCPGRMRHLTWVDIISGGFPCQDISNAGKRAGIDGERSGLWSEFARIIRELRPRYVVVENVAALLGRGMERVLGDLAACGYDAEWQSIRASDVGAPHRRERIWIVAYPSGISSESRRRVGDMGSAEAEGIGEASQRERIWNAADDCGSDVPDTAHAEVRTGHEEIRARTGTAIPIGPGNIRPSLAYAQQSRLERYSGDGAQRAERPQPQRPISAPRVFHTTDDSENSDGIRRGDSAGQWRAEPDVGRVAHGISSRVDRLRGLGNAVVPQITEWIGRRIVEAK